MNDVLPATYMLAECGRGSIFRFNLQQPINLKWYECKTEFVMRKNLPPFLFDIVAIATNPLLKRSSLHSHSSLVLQRFCLLSGLPTATIVCSLGQFQGQFTK